MSSYAPTCRCPKCGRRPNVQFSEDEVRRARRERQGANVADVKCQKCGSHYWIKARDIAASELEKKPKKEPKPKQVALDSGRALAQSLA